MKKVEKRTPQKWEFWIQITFSNNHHIYANVIFVNWQYFICVLSMLYLLNGWSRKQTPNKFWFWFKKHFRNFQNSKTKLKKDPLKIQNPKISTKSINFIKQTPPKVGILIQKTFSKFSKLKNQTQKRPPKNPKS